MTDPALALFSIDDPIPGLHALRENDPVHYVEEAGFWLITRHDDCKRLFNDTEYATHLSKHWERYEVPQPGTLRHYWAEHGLFTIGKAEHKRLRTLAASAFTPRAVRRMELQIREVIDSLAAPLRNRDGETVDFLVNFTNAIPNAVMSRITGVPRGDNERRFCQNAQSIVQGLLPLSPKALQDKAEKAFSELSEMIVDIMEQRKIQPQEDFVSDLLHAEEADESLTERDVIMLITALIAAGSDATAQVAAAVVKDLVEAPAILDQFRQDPSRIRSSINEILRYCFKQPGGTMRYAVQDFDLRGKKIKKGQMLMLSKAGAGRDPSVFENPDKFILDRNTRDSITFGYGPHFCLGAHLAREEISSIVETLIDLVPPGSSIDKANLKYHQVGIFRFADSLPVKIADRQTVYA